MDKNTLTGLAKDIYQLTLLFPTREPLRYKLREIADDAIAEFIMKKNNYLDNLERLFEVINSYLEIAIVQNWVSPAKIDEIKNNYAQATQELTETKKEPSPVNHNQNFSKEEIFEALPKTVMEPVDVFPPMIAAEPEAIVSPVSQPAAETKTSAQKPIGLTDSQIARQNRIMEYLKERGSAQVWEIQKIFPNVSKRTIRRDFRSLLRQGLIERTGERNTTAYKPRINLS